MTAGAWITYCVAVGGLVAGAAWLIDRGVGRLALPTRGVWVAALVLSVGLPVREALMGRAWTLPVEPQSLSRVDSPDGAGGGRTASTLSLAALFSESAQAIVGGLNTVIGRASRTIAPNPRSEGWLALLWMFGSLSVAIILLAGRVRLQRQVRMWPVARRLGTRIRVSERFGPATVGVRAPEIVIPRWCLDLDDPELRLVLDHEASHVTKADPMLLALASLPVVLFFWNPFLWWQLSRLRAAVEIDCDRRVLGRADSPATYAHLLVRLASAARPAGTAVAMAGSHSLLKRRILAMQTRPLTRTLPVALVATLAATVLVSVACSAQAPQMPDAPTRDQADQPAEADGAARAGMLADSIDAVSRERGDFARMREARGQRILVAVEIDTVGPSYAIALPAGYYALDPNGIRIAIDGGLVGPEFEDRLSALAGLGPVDIQSVGLIAPPESIEAYGNDGAGGVIEIRTNRN